MRRAEPSIVAERAADPATDMGRRTTSLRPAEWLALGALAAGVAVSWWQPPYPADQALHHSLTALALIALLLVRRRYAMPLSSFLLALAFLALHTLAARWLYSFVPYDSWTETLFGFRLSDELGWQRNHFDRLVHLTYGLCSAPILFRYFRDVRGWRRRWAVLVAVDIVVSTSALYELFEWGIALLLSAGAAEAYNGQQGDQWDAHRDMALALVGAVVGGLASIVATRSAGRHPRRTTGARPGPG